MAGTGLGFNFFKVNGTAILPPTQLVINTESIEDINTSEAGTDLAVVTRLGKHIFTCTWEGVTGAFADAIEGYASSASVTLTYDNTSYTCRARDFSRELAKKSYLHNAEKGYWTVSVKFTQV